MLFPRHFRRLLGISVLLVILVNWHLLRRSAPSSSSIPTSSPSPISSASVSPEDAQTEYPLLTKYIEKGKGSGGAWHLPSSWTTTKPFENVVDAAQFARNRSSTSPNGHIPHSAIPRIIHQTWKDTNFETWRQKYRDSAEKWLSVVDSEDIPYMFWDDAGVAQFMRTFEPGIEKEFYGLPSPVERSDFFRILVCKWIGGVYVDMDTEPLQSPTNWITDTDLIPWTDPKTGKLYDSTTPVHAIVGIEADTDPEKDTYWRMGYFFPVQLTQWSFAFAPHHPILQIFIDRLLDTIRLVARDQQEQQTLALAGQHEGSSDAAAEADAHPDSAFDSDSDSVQNSGSELFQGLGLEKGQGLDWIDPVNLTGPIAFTDSVRTYLDHKAGLRWNAVTGLQDGGQSKLVEDVLVLPITGFSPGSARFANMGSKPITDPSARLYHHATGSWRKWSLKVEIGKFCRTAFGLCKDWSKVSHGDNYLW